MDGEKPKMGWADLIRGIEKLNPGHRPGGRKGKVQKYNTKKELMICFGGETSILVEPEQGKPRVRTGQSESARKKKKRVPGTSPHPNRRQKTAV